MFKQSVYGLNAFAHPLSLTNCFNSHFLHFYNELKFHILSRDGIKISISSKSGYNAINYRGPLCRPVIIAMLRKQFHEHFQHSKTMALKSMALKSRYHSHHHVAAPCSGARDEIYCILQHSSIYERRQVHQDSAVTFITKSYVLLAGVPASKRFLNDTGVPIKLPFSHLFQ